MNVEKRFNAEGTEDTEDTERLNKKLQLPINTLNVLA